MNTKTCLIIGICALITLNSCFKKQKTDNAVNLESSIVFDLSNFKEESTRVIPGMSSVSPSGDELKVNNKFITFNGEPWIASFGEFEYQRYPSEHWEDALLKLKSQGFTGVSSYMFWINHEEEEGVWDFSGRNDLRRFIQLCKKHNLLFAARIGPWVNAEYRNGGHPDWLVKRLGDPKNPFGHSGSGGRLRSMDPDYLAYVDKYYQKIGEQMKGLYWKDGGPIVSVQLDNEYTPAHSGVGGTDLIEWEKATAIKYGMDVPIYTTTGWNGAEFIQDHTIQTHGSYAEYFWGTADKIFRTPAFSFSTLRAVDGIDTEVNYFDANQSTDIQKYIDNPYLTCETGIGMNMAYHRRPNVNYLDNGAVSLVELGSGCNGMGYFMAIGGSNPKGKHSYMNREMAHGANDNSVFSNDFQSAIGEFGQIRRSFHEYPVQLHFMTDFGKHLAPCQTIIPKEIDELHGQDLLNSKELQRAVRTDGKKGFVFVNNRVKNDTTYQFNNTQFEINLASETLKFPKKPFNIPIDSYFYWPFNLQLSGVLIKYATAQPILHLEESNTFVFFQNEGLPAEFAIDNTNISDIKTNNAQVVKKDSSTNIAITKAGLNCFIDVKLIDDKTVRFLVLDQKHAKQLYRNNNTLYLSDAEILLFKGDSLQVISEQIKNTIWAYPKVPSKNSPSIKDGLFEKFEVNFEYVNVPLAYTEIQNGKNIKFQNRTNNKSQNLITGVPHDSIFDKGTILSLTFPKGIPDSLYDVRVKIDYEASALRLYKNGEFIYDNYYNGETWVLGAKQLLPDYINGMNLELKFIPLQPDDKIYIDGEYWPNLNKIKNVLEVKSIKAIPVYKIGFKLN
ncbi:beta-galactosidase [Polaribacter staleyi]|uniref:beta-galactosidase n=1 Tax=Polaribacter staleyi TaxID=2022337 RepID=UPI0031BA5E78